MRPVKSFALTSERSKLEMRANIGNRWAAAVAAAMIFMSAPVLASAGAVVDGEAAEALARRENCLKCHGIDKDKSAPAYMRIAAKYRGKAGAEDELMEHVKSGEMVKLANGDEERHRIVRSADENAIRNLIRWILSL